MTGFNLPFKFPFKNAHNSSGIAPSIQSTQPVKLTASASPQPKKKSLAELEKEAEAKYYATYPHKQPQPVKAVKANRGVLSKIGLDSNTPRYTCRYGLGGKPSLSNDSSSLGAYCSDF